MKHIFLVNPAAGTGISSKIILPQLRLFINSKGEDFEIHRTLNKEEVGTYVKARASQGDPVRFYAVGGDGTVCDVVNGMVGYDNAELAIIPCGSGNDFVRNFTHKEYFLNFEKQVNGRVEYIDLIKYNDSYCVNMINIGTDCDIALYAGELRRQHKASGAGSYLKAALEIMPKGQTYDLEYSDKNGVMKRAPFMLIAVGNGKFCGGGFKACPKAGIRDGLMDIGLVRLCKGKDLARMLVKYHQGTHIYDKDYDKYGEYLQLSEFKIIPHVKMRQCVDGEGEEVVPMDVKVVHNAIKVVIPEGSDFLVK